MATPTGLSDLAKEFLEDQDPHEDPPAAATAAPQTDPDETHAADAPPSTPRRRAPAPPPRRAKTNTTLHLPDATARRLRQQAQDQGRTLDDIVLSAFLNHSDAVSARYVDESDRLRLGLRPLREVDAAEATTRVAVWISRDALTALDDAAASLVMNRSAYVAELLDAADDA